LTPPDRSEGLDVIRLRDVSEVNALLHRWGCVLSSPSSDNNIGPTVATGAAAETHLFKFPRTHHLLNPGGSAVTADDLLCSHMTVQAFTSGEVVIVQEKVDGGNLGISVTHDGELVTQNRSHFVNAASAPQWGTLDTWLAAHRDELLRVLVPGRHVLYGEWMRARHSVFYDRLPDTFLAFDILDLQAPPDQDGKAHSRANKPAAQQRGKSPVPKASSRAGVLPPPAASAGEDTRKSSGAGRFLGMAEVSRRLASTTICMVPLIVQKSFSSTSELLSLLDTKSAFSSQGGFVEGVYLRIEKDGYLTERSKLVRPDFVQGITTHWTKQKMVKNLVVHQ
jgi:hypothetical protein